MRQRIAKILIIAFCMWHMGAVALLSVSDTLQVPFAEALKKTELKDVLQQYSDVMFKQRQSWRMFTNPTKTVVDFSIDVRKNGKWVERVRLDAHYFNIINRSHNLKAIRRLADRSGKSGEDLRKAYLTMFCERLSIPAHSQVRLRSFTMLIPTKHVVQTQEWWSKWKPTWKAKTLTTLTCP